MDEYIKREDALKAVTYTGIDEPSYILSLTLLMAQKNIRKIPAADAVPVVRCKDCKHAQFMSSCSRYMCHKVGGCMRAEDDYCNYGERKEQP